ncbi:NADH-quinone oxidoreductase subunit L [Dissulfurirhabdus thermomarina]|uniref:NADH-quinone oxidoreductase subunit L n=1 Tax=Dissulfurirhabdus thermomarina TaxID=1765737 RepID=A0A6N9TK56_DISTH|nr:NADH-quinone oxidoreductase subunit L [Dissulfurirhabdus thermomarina]NDY41469.1 NADH-quinone oxidoreductase subunit L [Dissulfurirhabdus thermomarina]NMX24249.1 NADH-quinone oxidoreductase subunit L [Dissulfurirhabdus thermomarina]
MEGAIALIPLFPLAGFLLNGLLGKKAGKSFVSFVGCASVGLAFAVALLVFRDLLARPPEERQLVQVLWSWMAVGGFHADLAFLVDQLSGVMILVVTGVGFLIHIYSIGYMHDDESYWRYFAYLNMFVFFMAMLVLGANYVVMFVGWEGVGLASYLLIGFWYKGLDNAIAGKKAFVVNRIGDFGFVLGMFLMFVTFGSLSYLEVFPKAYHLFEAGQLPLDSTVMVAICLLLFLGATGKSAQIPLYVWLPDAMAGPTPVSALIHAATMVTAGVYMVARSNILYTLAPTALLVVAGVAAATALYAATIGILQNDIKKVLAYSTVSQLGYMFIGVGVAAYWAGIFHLVTHAFFKACLFLCSGSVIHAMGGDQDMRHMGGLARKMPVTYVTMLTATIAIAGIPPFAGFFSKDEILWKAFTFPFFPEAGRVIWLVGTIGAAVTAFYMFRLIFLTFHGSFRGTAEQAHHLHESPVSMTGPLVILAFLSFCGGWMGVSPLIGETLGGVPNLLEHFLEPVFEHSAEIVAIAGHPAHYSHGTEWGLMGLSVLVAVLGFLLAFFIYRVRFETLPARLAATFSLPYKLVYNKYYVDEIYEALVVKPVYYLSMVLWKVADVVLIDGLCVNGSAWAVRWTSSLVRRVQNGYLQTYAAFMALGVVAILCFLLFGEGGWR